MLPIISEISGRTGIKNPLNGGFLFCSVAKRPTLIAQDPVSVLAIVRSLVNEPSLIELYPLVGIDQGEMMMNLRQLPNEVR